METHESTSHFSKDYRDEVMTLKDWIITLLILIIPLVNIIMMFVWAFSSSENRNRSNFAKAYLVITLISIGLVLLFMLVFGSFFYSLGNL